MTTLSIDLIYIIIEFIKLGILNEKLFASICCDFMKEFEELEKKKFECFTKIIFSDKFLENAKYINGSEENLSTLLCILQVYFNKLDSNVVQNQLIEFMENDNENEQEYLEKSELAMKVKKTFDTFNKYSNREEYVSKIKITMDDKLQTTLVQVTFL